MNTLSWILFAACNAVSGMIGWQIRAFLIEHAQFRAEQRRDDEWDEQHGIRRD